MDIRLIQIVSLIYRYNEYVKTGTLPKNYLDSSAFANCNTVGYIAVKKMVPKGIMQGDLVAANPIKWFKYLENEGCKKLALYYHIPDKKENTNSEPAGTWTIEAIYEKYANFWITEWYDLPDTSKSSMWNARYFLISRFDDIKCLIPDLLSTKKLLKTVLMQLISFATDNDQLKYAAAYSSAFNALESLNPEIAYTSKDLIDNKRYPLLQRQVFYATGLALIAPPINRWGVKLSLIHI